MPKNLGIINDNLDTPTKQYVDGSLVPYTKKEIIDTIQTTDIAISDYIVGDTFILNDKLYKVDVAIATGEQIVPGNGGNCHETTVKNEIPDIQINGTSIVQDGVANVQYASSNTFGVVKTYDQYGIASSNGTLIIAGADIRLIKPGNDYRHPITPSVVPEATFYGLAKAAGDTTQSQSSNAVGTYTDEAKQSIQQMLGVSSLFAPSEPTFVASKAYVVGDVFTANGKLYKVTTAIAAAETIVVQNEGETVSGHNAEEVKVTDYAVHDVQVNGVSVVSDGVANVPLATTSKPGTFMVGSGLAIHDGWLSPVGANDAQIKAGTVLTLPVMPIKQHVSAFYGLSKVAGVDLANETVTLGTYPETSKSAIRSMLGATSSNVIAVQDTQPTNTDTKIWMPATPPQSVTVPTVSEMETALAGKVSDVQVNGTSVVNASGIANIPAMGNETLGVAKVSSQGYSGIIINGNTLRLEIRKANTTDIKPGTDMYRPVVPYHQHESVFYGLAKAAGDTTQSQSDNAVGTYTDSAKASIKSMLSIVDGSTGTVDVTGTTPTITAIENTRYVCGEVATLSITPPESGICIIRFTSGTTATVLTATGVVWPEWFDATALEASRVYEICITDGYGAVMSWAL